MIIVFTGLDSFTKSSLDFYNEEYYLKTTGTEYDV